MDEPVEPVVSRAEAVRKGVDCRPVGHVQERSLGPAAGRPDGTGHRLGPISVAPDDPYLGTEGPESQRGCPADAG